MTIHCPRCQSPNVVSNKISDTHVARAADVARASQAVGLKQLTVFAGLAAVGLRAANALRKEHACSDCGYRFDA